VRVDFRRRSRTRSRSTRASHLDLFEQPGISNDAPPVFY
jgi:hypothetical protein